VNKVHNVSQRRQIRESAHKISWRSVQRSQRYARGHTDWHR